MDFNSLSELLANQSCRYRYATTSLHQLKNLPPEQLPEVNFGLSQKRNQEYLLGRLAIKDALGSLGYPPTWIERDPLTKSPVWPEGITGSLSHSSGLALAVVGDSPPILGLGVDLEKANRTIDLGIERHICTQDESDDLRSLHPENHAIRLLLTFSAKESLYKCFFGKIPRDLLRFKNVSLKWESSKWTAHWKFPSEKKYSMETTIGYWGMDQNWLWTICWR
ncbi:MAG: 4'-phosphopantetheinyl transferase family protein [bacterium]